MKFSKEKLIYYLKSLNREHVSQSYVDSLPNIPCSSTYKRVFGSWSNALCAAGLKGGLITGRPVDPPIMLTKRACDIIYGELLGDGSLTSYSSNSLFEHSTANFSYSNLLFSELKSEGLLLNQTLVPSRNGSNEQLKIRTVSNITFSKMRKEWYHKIKIIPEWLELNKIIARHWYYGDGYIDNNRVYLSTCGFTKDQNIFLSELLNKIGFFSEVLKRSGGYYIIRLKKRSDRDFLHWIGPPINGYYHRWKLTGKQ